MIKPISHTCDLGQIREAYFCVEKALELIDMFEKYIEGSYD